MSEPIRVLHVVTHMNRGGLETMIMNYYRHIDRTKIQFDFLTHRTGKKDYDDEITSLGGKIYHLPSLNPFSFSYRKALKTFFNEHPEYQIVHSHLDCMSSIPLMYAKKAGIKNRIAHAHSTSQDENLKFLIKKIYMQKIPKYATALYACGEESGKWMFSNKKFQTLYNAIDLEEFTYNENIRNKMRDELNVSNQLVLGHVGRFCYPKNHSFLIDVFNEIYQQNEHAILLLVGTGELEGEIRDKVKKLQLEKNVKFLGLRTNIAQLLNAMDGFIFPSNYEGLPVSIIEAQATGMQCFISNHVPIECIVTKNVSIISLDESPQKWADIILEKINEFKRLSVNESIINAGFDINENARKLQKSYLEMVR